MKPAFLKALKQILSADSVLTSEHDRAIYCTDWTKTPGKAGAVALPRTTAEVAKILAVCQRHSVAVVPSGGRTGLAGGAVATDGELVLSLGRMNRLSDVSQLSRTVRVQAGAVTESVHQHCEASGLIWPIDLASKGSCQIGGNLSTNAGGVRVIRYGVTRKWVSALQIVTAAGTVLELNAELEKNNSGYDLLQLVVGSEGTLAVITEASLKLTLPPPDTQRTVLFFSVRELEGLSLLLSSSRMAGVDILAFEFFSQRCLEAVTRTLGRTSRLSKPGKYYVLMEVGGALPTGGWLEKLISNEDILDALAAESSQDRQRVWGLREGITESLSRAAAIRKHDLSLPVASMTDFLSDVESEGERFRDRIDLYLFGHFGDGSPHVNLVCPPQATPKTFQSDCDAFEKKLFSILKTYRGSISSEHGIGLLKKKWLAFSRTPEEIRIFKAIKKAMDPKGLLNPGKIF